MRTRIMYIEEKGSALSGEARIGRVAFSKSGSSIYYRGNRFETLKGDGYKANYFEVESGDFFWISGCKADGQDRLYPGMISVDDDVQLEYWTQIRKAPECTGQTHFRSNGKYRK